MSKIALTPNSLGSGTFTIASPNSDTDRVLTLPDEAGTVLTSASSISASQVTSNVPAFRAYKSASFTLNNLTSHTIPFDAETLDTNGWYNTSTYRFQPTVAGYYMIAYSVAISDASATGIITSHLRNESGSTLLDGASGYYESQRGFGVTTTSGLVYFNGSTNYAYVEALQYTGGNRNMGNGFFSGFLVRAD